MQRPTLKDAFLQMGVKQMPIAFTQSDQVTCVTSFDSFRTWAHTRLSEQNDFNNTVDMLRWARQYGYPLAHVIMYTIDADLIAEGAAQ